MELAIELNNIYRSFKNHFWQKPKQVLNDVSLKIHKGEIFGFLGPNGAGKTTTIKIITGLIRPDSGSVKIFNAPANTIDAKKHIGFLPESPYFYEHLTGFEFLNIHARLGNVKEHRVQSKLFLERVGLQHASDLPLFKYSRGMLQRIGIAQALISDPDLFILDEPLTGLDPIGRKEIKDLIMEQKNKGKTIFFSSHILPDAEAVCDRIGIIIKGKIMHIGKLKDILKQGIKTDEITLEEWFVEQIRNSHA
ncbi:MAG: ABC transporter ATP-binding protein [bacterium]